VTNYHAAGALSRSIFLSVPWCSRFCNPSRGGRRQPTARAVGARIRSMPLKPRRGETRPREEDAMSHTFSKLFYHCIFSTKGRRNLIAMDIRERLYAYIGGIIREHDGRPIQAGGTANHVHLVLELPTATPISEAMRLIKANVSKWVHETFPTQAAFGWQTGYAAFTVSASSLDTVVRYVATQEHHHRSKTFDEEYVEFLARHELEYDGRYLWD